MVLVTLILITIIAQVVAAIISMRLTKTTKYNAAWVLVTIGLSLTAILMMGQFIGAINDYNGVDSVFRIGDNLSLWLSVSISLCFAIGVFLINKVLVYISGREDYRRKNEERILNAIIKAEDAQRQSFAKELHDDLGPLLSTVNLSMSALAAKGGDETDKKIIDNAQQAISQAIKSLKNIANNLSPHILNNFGVVRALNNFIIRCRPAVDTEIMFDTNLRTERFSTENEILIYRIICELINNSLKHAKAKHLLISLEYRSNSVEIQVKDDGTGFDTETATEGMGLYNLHSRVGSVRGSLEIDSHEKSGTWVTIHLPISIIA